MRALRSSRYGSGAQGDRSRRWVAAGRPDRTRRTGRAGQDAPNRPRRTGRAEQAAPNRMAGKVGSTGWPDIRSACGFSLRTPRENPTVAGISPGVVPSSTCTPGEKGQFGGYPPVWSVPWCLRAVGPGRRAITTGWARRSPGPDRRPSQRVGAEVSRGWSRRLGDCDGLEVRHTRAGGGGGLGDAGRWPDLRHSPSSGVPDRPRSAASTRRRAFGGRRTGSVSAPRLLGRDPRARTGQHPRIQAQAVCGDPPPTARDQTRANPRGQDRAGAGGGGVRSGGGGRRSGRCRGGSGGGRRR